MVGISQNLEPTGMNNHDVIKDGICKFLHYERVAPQTKGSTTNDHLDSMDRKISVSSSSNS